MKINFLFAVGVLLVSMAGMRCHAREVRFLNSMPTTNKSSAAEILKSKKPGYECTKVKIGGHGNAVNVPGSTSQWFTDVPQSEDSADDALASGKKIVRCNLKIYNKEKHRMTNADLGDAE